MKPKPQGQAARERRAFLQKLIAAEILARRGEGPLALRPPLWAREAEGAVRLGGRR